MHDANGYIYFGSLEAAARFGGRLGLRQQAEHRDEQGPKVDSIEEHLELIADPPAPIQAKPDVAMQWGRCGMARNIA